MVARVAQELQYRTEQIVAGYLQMPICKCRSSINTLPVSTEQREQPVAQWPGFMMCPKPSCQAPTPGLLCNVQTVRIYPEATAVRDGELDGLCRLKVRTRQRRVAMVDALILKPTEGPDQDAGGSPQGYLRRPEHGDERPVEHFRTPLTTRQTGLIRSQASVLWMQGVTTAPLIPRGAIPTFLFVSPEKPCRRASQQQKLLALWLKIAALPASLQR
jgi:hypothetical protein